MKGETRIHSDILKTDFVYDIHAVQRAFERKITEDDIVKIINDKNIVCERQMNGRFRLSSEGITIIAEYEKSIMRIITVFER